MKVVAMIPIKLHSQRLKNKNILPLAGHPLCWHICNTLNDIKEIDEVYVYCSDVDIAEYLPPNTRVLKRPDRLDADLVKGEEIYREFINTIDAEIYILAHTTSPFIQKNSLVNALSMVASGEYDSAFSAERIQTFAWYDSNPINYKLDNIPRTQDLVPIWVETSGFYIFRKSIFTDYNRRIGFKPYIQEVVGIEAIDIDEMKDYRLACLMAENQRIGER